MKFVDPRFYPVDLPSHDIGFLEREGLPEWAAPHMMFWGQVDENGLEAVLNGVIPIGETGEDWPIYIGPTAGSRSVSCFRGPDEGFMFMNSSVMELSLCLKAIESAVDRALDYGERHGNEDAWRLAQYPSHFDDDLWSEMLKIDSPVGQGKGYWEYCLMNGGRFSEPEESR